MPQPQIRRLLCLLVARAGDEVTADELIEHLWGSGLPADPRAALRVVLSRLRSLLGEHSDALVARPDRQAFALAADSDVGEFDRSVRDADDPNVGIGARIGYLQEALALWHGVAFADAPDAPLLAADRADLDMRREKAIEDLGLALVAERRFGEAVSVLRPAMAEHGDREAVAVGLAGALAGEGRKVEALGVLDQCRSTLREMGLGTSAEFAEFERDVLATSTDIGSRATDWSNVAIDRAFVGRHRETVALLESRASLVIAGPGMGKSALLAHIAQTLSIGGTDVVEVSASASPDVHIEVLAALIDELDGAAFAKGPVEQAALQLIDPDSTTGSAASLARDALVDGLASIVERSIDDKQICVIVDDAQWMDPVSAATVAKLGEGGNVRLICASRPTRASRLPVAGALGEDAIVELEPFNRDEVRELVETVIVRTANEDALTNEIYERTDGNPLFVRLLLDLVEQGVPLTELPASVLLTVQQRLGVLSAAAREAVDVAAVLGAEFDLGALHALAEEPEVLLAEVQRGDLLRIDIAAGAGRFAHALIAEGAYQMLPSGRRLQLHDLAATWFETNGAPAMRWARHAQQAATFDLERAIRANHKAATDLEHTFDWEQVRDFSAAALAMTKSAEVVDLSRLAQLGLVHGRALRALGDSGSKPTLVHAAEHARQAQDSELFARVVTEICNHGPATLNVEVESLALGELIDEALTSSDILAADLRAELQAGAAGFYSLSADQDRTRRLFTEALSWAQQSDSHQTKARVLLNIRRGLVHPDDFSTRLEAVEDLRRISSGDVGLEFEAAIMDFTNALVLADGVKLSSALVEMRGILPRYTGTSTRHFMSYPTFTEAYFSVGYELAAGRVDRADAQLKAFSEAGPGISDVLGTPIGMFAVGALLFMIRMEQERLPELRSAMDGIIEAAAEPMPWMAASAAVAAAEGDRQRAVEDLRTLSVDGFASVPKDVPWSGAMMCAARAIEFVGDVSAAEVLHALLVPYSGRLTWNGFCSMGPIDSALAMTARTFGDDAAADRFDRSAQRTLADFDDGLKQSSALVNGSELRSV